MGLGLRNLGNRALAFADAFQFRLSQVLPAGNFLTQSGQCRGNWLFDRDSYVDALQSIQGHVEKEARLVLDHRLDILGTGLQHWGDRLPWNLDINSGRRWPGHYYKRIKHHRLTGAGGSDVKVPWELSRFQHIVPLVQGYLLSGDDRCAREVVDQISDWMCKNPFCHGVNWVCAMEVAIRACNWMYSSWALNGAAAWDCAFNSAFMKSIWQHGLFIENNLEDKGGIRTNHYLSDIVGLLFISVLYPELKKSDGWKEFALSELVLCMEQMVYKDGTSFENSTYYHRLVLELFAYSALLCKRNGIVLPEGFLERLENMFKVVSGCLRPDGRMPVIGDNDDGRLFIPGRYYDWDRTDFSYLSSIEVALFGVKNSGWTFVGESERPETFFTTLFASEGR